MTTKRRITPHKGGRTAIVPSGRIRPQTLQHIHATMREQGKSFADLVEETYGGNTMTLEDAIKATVKKNGGTCEFSWDSKKKMWCLSGTTVDHLYWESDDYEAANERTAKNDASEYLIEYNNLP